jgi:NDP-sugar pyrophosphorylase family protein
VRAVILAGGEGTRLRPYTTVIPKPLVPVGNRPILEILINQLARAGVERIDLCVGHLGELIKAYFSESDATPSGVELKYHWEKNPLGTAGALTLIDDLDEPFLALNGDVLTTLDYGALMRSHLGSDAALTIATHTREVRIELGVIEQGDGLVHGYQEKPTLRYTVSMGVYAYDPSALSHISSGRVDFPDVVDALLEGGKSVMTYPFDGVWLDVGTFEEHERASALAEADPGLLGLD